MKEVRYEIQEHAKREHESVDAMLAEWRRKATHVIMGTITVVFSPLIVIILAGYGPPVTALMNIAVLGTYVLLVFQSLFWRMDYRSRARLSITLGYMLALIGGIALPHGPFMRAAPLFFPMMAMVLLGKRAGYVTVGISLLLLLCTPVLSARPRVVELLIAGPPKTPAPMITLFSQGLAMMALLAAMMVLLDRFHDFLLQSLIRLQKESHELARAMAESKRLEQELIRIADEERRRLGQEIHDGVCQQLAGVLLGVGALSRKLGRKGTVEPEDLSGLSSLVEESIDEARGVARGLCPLTKDAGALATALRVLAKRTSGASGIPVVFTAEGGTEIEDSIIANHLYRIVQEALNNAIRHARPSKVNISLQGNEQELILAVEDDGDGLPLEISKEGMGLRTMAHRANLMEAEFAITRVAPKGTHVSCRVSRTGLKPRDDQQREGT